LDKLYRKLLEEIGEDPARDGLVKTPERAAEALRFLTQGYKQDVGEILNDAIYEEPGEDMVIIRDIEFFSLCEHHLLPFFGKVHIGYLPAGKIVGISKLARLVDMFARRLQVQERMTQQVARAIDENLKPLGVIVVVQAAHFCMIQRGVEQRESMTLTTARRGAFLTNPALETKFQQYLKLRSDPAQA